jgi:PRC-barrel domain protein
MQNAKAQKPAEPKRLCYLDASQIQGALHGFDGVEVRNQGHRIIGRLDGIVIDPAAGSVRYLVINDERYVERHRYLLPLDAAQVDVERKALCVEVDRKDLSRCEEFDALAFSRFSFRPRPH